LGGIVTRLEAETLMNQSSSIQTSSGANPTFQPVSTRSSFLFKGDRVSSRPLSDEVKIMCSYNAIPQYIFMAWYLIKHRNKTNSMA
jgi:hypothetical protein